MAKTMTLARIATAEGVDKRYERSWLRGVQRLFPQSSSSSENGVPNHALIRRGDFLSVPVWRDRPLVTDEEPDMASDSEPDDEEVGGSWSSSRKSRPTALVYFVVTGLSFEPLVPLEEDFGASATSKARAGESGCWVDFGPSGTTKVVLNGIERAHVPTRANDQSWHDLRASVACRARI